MDRGRHHRSSRDTLGRWRQLCRFRLDDGRTVDQLRASELQPSFPSLYRAWRMSGHTRRGRPPAPGTVNREIEKLRAVINHAVKTGRIPPHPLQHIELAPEDNIRETRIGSEEELERLLASCAERHEYLVPLALLYMDAGLRRLEGMQARWSELEFKPGGGARLLLSGRRTKSGQGRYAHLTKRTADALARLPRVSEWVFANTHVYRTGRKSKWYGQPMSQFYLYRCFEDAVKASGLEAAPGEKITIHTLRHSFAYRARRRWRWPEAVIMRQGGWKTRSAFDRYGIADDAELEEAMVDAEARIAAERRGLKR